MFHGKKNRVPPTELYQLLNIHPYVGIIQIRLWVETNQSPLSRLQPAPRITIILYWVYYIPDIWILQLLRRNIFKITHHVSQFCPPLTAT